MGVTKGSIFKSKIVGIIANDLSLCLQHVGKGYGVDEHNPIAVGAKFMFHPTAYTTTIILVAFPVNFFLSFALLDHSVTVIIFYVNLLLYKSRVHEA